MLSPVEKRQDANQSDCHKIDGKFIPTSLYQNCWLLKLCNLNKYKHYSYSVSFIIRF